MGLNAAGAGAGARVRIRACAGAGVRAGAGAGAGAGAAAWKGLQFGAGCRGREEIRGRGRDGRQGAGVRCCWPG